MNNDLRALMQKHTVSENNYRELLGRYAELMGEAMKLRAALKFYEKREHWQHSNAYAENTTICDDDQYCYKGDYFFGGRSAIKAAASFDRYLERLEEK